jgi:hypothetical protein
MPHSMPYAGWNSFPAAETSYLKHPQHYQKLGKNENFDVETCAEFKKFAGDVVEGRDILGPVKDKFTSLIAKSLGDTVSFGSHIKPVS